MWRTRRGRACGREVGAAAVEFGLLLPVFMMILGGIIDFGRMYNQQILLSNAARDGVRQVVVNQDPANGGWSSTQIQSRISSAASPLSVSSTATAWYCSASGTSLTVTVSLTQPFDYTVLKFLPGLPKPVLKGTATMTCA